jgi:hypothetical protein
LALGLLASLLAHGALYGHEHEAGGGYHILLLETAVAGLVAFVSAIALFAWSGARSAVDGSVLSARLASRLPGFGPLAVSAALWFALTEALEPRHADASFAGTAICLTAAAWIIAALCRWFCALLAEAILAIVGTAFRPRSLSWLHVRDATPPRRRTLCTHRRFARPPPVGSLIGA